MTQIHRLWTKMEGNDSSDYDFQYALSTDSIESDRSQPPSPDGTGLPVNFAIIGPGLYRSSYPLASHFPTLESYRFKTIVTFVNTPIPAENLFFMAENGIAHHQIHVLANKNPEVYATDDTVAEILKLMFNREHHPVLIHCNKGKHRTGCIAAIFRKCTGWPLDACLAEYEKYSCPKSRDLDRSFIARFDVTAFKAVALENGFVNGAFSSPYDLTESSNASAYTNYTVASYESTSTMNTSAQTTVTFEETQGSALNTL